MNKNFKRSNPNMNTGDDQPPRKKNKTDEPDTNDSRVIFFRFILDNKAPNSDFNDNTNSDIFDDSYHDKTNFISGGDDSDSESGGENDESDSDEIIDCYGPNCNHKRDTTNVPPLPEHLIAAERDYKITLQDLIKLGEAYHCRLQWTFGHIDLERLARMHSALTKLHNVVGMNKIKESIVEQIIYFLQDLEPNPTEMLHTVLMGPPGTGKSLVIEILAELYISMGYLKKRVIKRVKLNDLKGKYVGHTAPLTQSAIDSAMGGVLVIDEAYSLASADRIDSFSKEIIDTLNRNLTEHAGKFICIIAGYADQIDSCLFANNEGLRSRFRFRFQIDSYSANELAEIFSIKAYDNGWGFCEKLNADVLSRFFKKTHKDYEYQGRDMESLLFHSKIAHSNRSFLDEKSLYKELDIQDIEEGYKRFALHNSVKEESKLSAAHMYL